MMGSLSRKVVALVVATASASALWAGVVEAGVVLHQQEIVSQKEHHSPAFERVIEIEGSKEKIADKRAPHDLVIDLTGKQTLFIHPASKDYFLTSFPPKGSTAQWMALPLVTPPLLNYKNTGKSSTAIGYSCQEFSGDGEFYGDRYSVQACYSTTAPGADAYSAFVKKAADQLSSFAPAGVNLPSGVPLWMRITRKGVIPPAVFPPKKDLKKRPVPTPSPGPQQWIEIETRSLTVTSIETTKEPIPDGHFVPKGFEARQPANLGF
jgi:hypothetical protein